MVNFGPSSDDFTHLSSLREIKSPENTFFDQDTTINSEVTPLSFSEYQNLFSIGEETIAKFYALNPEFSKDGSLHLVSIDLITNPEQASQVLANNLLIAEFMQEGSEGPQFIACPAAAALMANATTINITQPNGTVQSHATSTLNIQTFTPAQLAALSGFMLAAFAAAEARKRMEEKRKEDEEKLRHLNKNGPQQRTSYAEGHSLESKKTAELSLSESKTPNVTFKRTEDVIPQEIENFGKKQLEQIEKNHKKMITNVKYTIEKSALDKSIIQGEIKKEDAIDPQQTKFRTLNE